MRQLNVVLCGSVLGLALMAAPHIAAAQQMAKETKGKDCRMEQQCHWKDFKKICVWVKICR